LLRNEKKSGLGKGTLETAKGGEIGGKLGENHKFAEEKLGGKARGRSSKRDLLKRDSRSQG